MTFSHDSNGHLDVRELEPCEHAVQGADGVWYVEGEEVGTYAQSITDEVQLMSKD